VPREQLLRQDPPRLDLDDDVRDGVEQTHQRHEQSQTYGAAIVVGDHVGGGQVALFAADAADASAQQVDGDTGDGDIEAEQREDDTVAVDHTGRPQQGEGAEEGGHDRQRRHHPALAAPHQVVVLLALLLSPAVADDTEHEQQCQV